MSLARKAVRGAVWTVITSLLGRFLGVLGTLALTYFLAPDVVGEVATASILVMTAGQLSLVGFGQYLVAHRDLDPRAVWQLTVLTIGLGIVALGGLVAVAVPLALARGEDALASYLPPLALSIGLARVGIVPERLLIREMRFGYVGAGRTVGEVVQAVVAVALAWLGWGGQAIVVGNLAASAIKLGWYAAAVDRRAWLTPHPLDGARVRDIFRYGAPLWLGTGAQFISRNWDNLLIARLFGDGTMGLYKQAYNLADIPTAQVGEAIGDVLLPSFARVDDAMKARSLVRAVGLLGLIVFPLAVGLGAVAPTLVAAVFNAEWQGIAPLLTVLAALSVARPIGWIVASYLQATARTRAIMFLELGRAVGVLGAIGALSPLGPMWAAGGVGVGFGLHALASLWLIDRLDRVPIARMLRPMVGPLLACAVMTLAVLAVRRGLGGIHPIPALGVEMGVGAVAYVGACFVVAREVTRDAIGLLRSSFGRRRA